MGKKDVDKENILGYIKQGWNFRIKVVKGRRYITRRKGQVERGFGSFDPDLWATISQMKEKKSDKESLSIRRGPGLDEGTKELPNVVLNRIRSSEVIETKWRRLQEEISMHRGVQMMLSCMYRDEEGFCSYWNWENKPNFFGLLDDLIGSEMYKKKRISRDGLTVDRWLVRTMHWYCSRCSVYKPRSAQAYY